jgi:hypothetical protein
MKMKPVGTDGFGSDFGDGNIFGKIEKAGKVVGIIFDGFFTFSFFNL